jgi:hypothetical protein
MFLLGFASDVYDSRNGLLVGSMQGAEASPLLSTGTRNEMRLDMRLALALALGKIHTEGVCTDHWHYYYFVSGYGRG